MVLEHIYFFAPTVQCESFDSFRQCSYKIIIVTYIWFISCVQAAAIKLRNSRVDYDNDEPLQHFLTSSQLFPYRCIWWKTIWTISKNRCTNIHEHLSNQYKVETNKKKKRCFFGRSQWVHSCRIYCYTVESSSLIA